jgi:hypothetical protein
MKRLLPSLGVLATLMVSGPFSAFAAPGPTRFEDCGLLVQGVECVLFQADAGGLYVLENYGSFQVGDRVQVIGTLDPTCFTFCMQGDGCIQDNSIGLCGSFDDCGVLIQGVECVLFQADAGGVYVLDNYGGFHVGDRVHVQGTLDPGCFTFCMQGDGCIRNNSIRSCLLGDLNCDGVLNAFDIDPFVLALTDELAYAGAYPDCDRNLADCNQDGAVNAFDIDPFVELLTGG